MLNRNFAIALAVAMVLAVLYGCSSSGGIKDDRDMYKEQAEMLQGSLDTANAEVMSLTGELATATMNAADLQIQLDASMDNAADLQMQLDASMDNAADLQMQLTASMDNAADLQMQLTASMDNAADLQMQLTASMDNAGDLQMQLTASMDNAADLQMQLDASMDNAGDLQMQLDASMDNAADLQMQLTDETGRADGLQTDLGTATDTIADLEMRLAAATGTASAMSARNAAYAAAQNARDDATDAAMDAMGAVEAATEAVSRGLTARAPGVAGVSERVIMNAQAVLDARDELTGFVNAAEAALQRAEEALAALGPDPDAMDPLTRALKAAIMAAKEQRDAAKGHLEGEALKMAVAAVEVDEDMPMSPADHGEAVAMEVAMALLPAGPTDGGRMRGMHHATAPAADTFEDAVMMNDHQGMTWAEIVGDANIMEMRIAGADAGTSAVKAASFDGMPLTAITSGAPEAGEVEDGTEFGMADYSGIPGTVFCAGSCKVEGDEEGSEMLTGSWYFTPDSDTAWYVGDTDEEGVTTYSAEVMYVTFGHWLAANDGALTDVNTYALTAGTGITSGLDVTTVDEAEDAMTLTDSSATYEGLAAGMSIEKTTDTDGKITDIGSDAFTAEVNLKATFGDSPTLGGTVDNFQGAAADSGWSVELQVTAFEDATVTGGRTVATGRDGEWSATGYGTNGERPMGVFGGFNAHFTDGHAAGAYSAR